MLLYAISHSRHVPPLSLSLFLSLSLSLSFSFYLSTSRRCVNDVIVQGAEPLYFLDYAATGKLEPAAMTAIVSGVAKGCIDSNCALIGGETAEMPQMYADGHFDLAGFSVGAVKRGAILPRLEEVQAGDVIIGCASSGVHSNGFSMVRKIVSEGGFAFDDAAPFAAVGGDGSESLVEALLVPTRLYVLSVLNAIKVCSLRPTLSSPLPINTPHTHTTPPPPHCAPGW